MATVTLTIPAGQSLSNAGVLTNVDLEAIIMPSGWDERAPLSFQLSIDGTNFYDVSAIQSDQVFTMPCVANHIVPTRDIGFPKNTSIKVRSGFPVSPINQTADRAFTLVTS